MGVGSAHKRLLRHQRLVIFSFPEAAVRNGSRHF